MKIWQSAAASLVAVLGLTLVAWGQDKPLVEKKDPAAEPRTEQEFLVKAISCESGEIALLEYVAENAQHERMKQLAGEMKQHHQKLREGLLQQASELKVGVVAGLEKEHRDRMARLRDLEGAARDQALLKEMIDSHQKSAQTYGKWAESAKTQGVRDVAARAHDAAERHLKQLKDLKVARD